MRELVRDVTKEPIHEYLVRTVNVGLAAKVLRDVLEHKEVPLQRERVALAIWNKLVPSMAAIAIEHRTEGPESIHDLNAMLLSTGLEALTTDPQVLDIVPEKVIASEEKLEGAAPRDSEA